MQQPAFAVGEIYHVYNRGVEKRTTFQDSRDYLRFIHGLFVFNDEDRVTSSNVRLMLVKPSTANASHLEQHLEVKPPNVVRVIKKRKLLVDILAFCLMPNHFHLLLRQRVENGIPLFMQKLGTGYTMTFNKRHERVGSLFQGTFKAIAIEKDVHFLHLPFYIHANPVDLIAPNWHEHGIEDMSAVMDFLENYRWSSYRDYIGEKNFPSVTQRQPLLKLVGDPTPAMVRKQMRDWLKNFSGVHATTIRAVQIEDET